MKKKTLNSVMATCMILPCVFAFNACGGDGSKGGTEGLSYSCSSNTYYYVTGIGKAKDANIVIPTSYKDLPVCEIEPRAFESYCTSITSIEIPDTIFKIGNVAFVGCTSLTSITIPVVFTNEFYTLFGDDSTSIPETLKEVTITSNSAYKLEDIPTPSLRSSANCTGVIGERQFAWCRNVTDITLVDGMTTIGDYAFAGCRSLTNLHLPATITQIGEDAFDICSALETVYYAGSQEEWLAIDGYEELVKDGVEIIYNATAAQ